MKQFIAVLHARNLEFLRDRAALSWNLILPLLLVLGFAVLFSDENRAVYKVGYVGELTQYEQLDFFTTKYLEFVRFDSRDKAIAKVDSHRVDLVINLNPTPVYWINSTSPKGYIVEKMLWGSEGQGKFTRQEVHGEEIRYVDWIVPGILGLNIMFSCLFGVGYVIVRYRKSGFLKRLKATPLTPIKFLLAQMISRLILIQAITVIVYTGCDFFLDFQMKGSYVNLFLLSTLGSISMIALGLLVAARMKSEEFAGGILNMITWPMMILSGVWFSLEGTPELIQLFAQTMPLTHMVNGARAIMTEGAGLFDIAREFTILGIMSVVFLFIGASIFRWE
ncbi:MAG: ABC transporter permease [Gammaproteobacteria bacterium]|nr:ABC transporter permease [Gammaproteobacteria bacterium]